MNAIDKLFAVFSLFSDERPEWTVEAAAEQLGLPASTTYRFFRSLSDEGLIVAYVAGRYVLGPAIIQLDRQLRTQDPLIKAASATMKELAEAALDGTFLLCRLYRNQVICVHQETKGVSALTSSYERGRLMPLHRGAASKIILAQLTARTVRNYHNANGADMAKVNLGRDWDTVKQTLRSIRKSGWCVTHAELDPGAIGIAAPLFLPDNVVVGSIGFVFMEKDIDENSVLSIRENLILAADRITHRLLDGTT